MIEPDRPNSPMHGPATITASIPVRDLVNDRDDVKIEARNDATGKYVAIGALVRREERTIVPLDEYNSRSRSFGVGDRVQIYASTRGYPHDGDGIVVLVNDANPDEQFSVYRADRGTVVGYARADLSLIERAHYASPSLELMDLDENAKNALDFAASVLECIAQDGEYIVGADERIESFGEVAAAFRDALSSDHDREPTPTLEPQGMTPAPGPSDEIVRGEIESGLYDIRAFDMQRVSGPLISRSETAFYVAAGRDIAIRVPFSDLDGPMSYMEIAERTEPGQHVTLLRDPRGVRVAMHDRERERVTGEVER
jgi:hypothetical protein